VRVCYCLFFFFSSRRRHTRWPRDWSSDVCSSDLRVLGTHFFNPATKMRLVEIVPGPVTSRDTVKRTRALVESWRKTTVLAKDTQIGRASCRERVEISGGGVTLKKK